MFLRTLVLFILVGSYSTSADNLVSTVMVFRHGDRTPRKFYPSDPYKNNSFWPVPFGELTQVGARQAYELGQWAQERYRNFIPRTYSSNDFFIYSSGIDRTLMSASAFSGGLYSADPRKATPSQPFPIHSKPTDLDNTIISEVKPCPKRELLLNNLLNSEYFRNKDREYADLYRYLSENMGMNISTFYGIEDYYDTLFIEDLYNFTLPEWTKKIFPENFKTAASLNLKIHTYNKALAKFKVGPLFSEILAYFTSFTNQSPLFESDFHMGKKGRKLLAISAHDTNIVGLLHTLGVSNIIRPPYSSSIIFELRKTTEMQYYVNIFYKYNNEVSKITIRGCDFNCSLEDFIIYLRPIVMSPKKWQENCAL